MTDGILAFLIFVRDAVIGVLMAWLGVSVAENATSSDHKAAPAPQPAAIHMVQSAEKTPCPETGGGGAPRVQATGTAVSRSQR